MPSDENGVFKVSGNTKWKGDSRDAKLVAKKPSTDKDTEERRI